MAPVVFHECRAVLDPIAVVTVEDSIDCPQFRAMDMPANHTIKTASPGNPRRRCLKSPDVGHRVRAALLDPGRERPVRPAESPTDGMNEVAYLEQHIIKSGAQYLAPARELD